MATKNIVDIDQVADVLGCSRRTVSRMAQKKDSLYRVGNKNYVCKSNLKDIFGEKYSAFLKKAREIPETKTKVGDLLTLQEVADIVGTSRTTVCRIIDRSSVETISVGSRRMLREKQIPRIKRLIKPQGNPVCYNREKMRKQSIAMLKARWGNG